jgi:hypothetical protein
MPVTSSELDQAQELADELVQLLQRARSNLGASMHDLNDFIAAKEAAYLLQLSVSQVSRLKTSQDLTITFAGHEHFSRQKLIRFLAGRRVPERPNKKRSRAAAKIEPVGRL